MLVFLQVRDTIYNLKSSTLVSKHGHPYIQRQSSSNINSQVTHCARATRILYTNRQFTRVRYVNTLYTFFLMLWNPLYLSEEEWDTCYIYHGISGVCKPECDWGEKEIHGMGECHGLICCYHGYPTKWVSKLAFFFSFRVSYVWWKLLNKNKNK